jgi:hypothetical protein
LKAYRTPGRALYQRATRADVSPPRGSNCVVALAGLRQQLRGRVRLSGGNHVAIHAIPRWQPRRCMRSPGRPR